MDAYQHIDEIDQQIITIAEGLDEQNTVCTFEGLAKQCGLPVALVLDRIQLMMKNGVIKRVYLSVNQPEAELSEVDQKVLTALQPPLSAAEVVTNCWANRAKMLGMELEEFHAVLSQLSDLKCLGALKLVV